MEDEKILIRNASQVVTCSGFEAKKGKAMSDVGIIEDGAVAVSDGIITHVGPTEDVYKRQVQRKGGALEDQVGLPYCGDVAFCLVGIDNAVAVFTEETVRPVQHFVIYFIFRKRRCVYLLCEYYFTILDRNGSG